MATLFIPTPLRQLTGGKSRVSVEAATIAELIDRMEASYPGFKERLLDQDGEIKRYINVFVDGQEIRRLQNAATSIDEASEVTIIPAMAGGGLL
jgi:molybdopterin synthase sulfur carrier subunit